MESMYLTRWEWFREYNHVYPNTTTGLQREPNSTGSVTDLVCSLQQEYSRWRITTAVFLDVKGAFDCITHVVDLDALVEIGVGQCFVDRVAYYLQSRFVYTATPNEIPPFTASHEVFHNVQCCALQF